MAIASLRLAPVRWRDGDDRLRPRSERQRGAHHIPRSRVAAKTAIQMEAKQLLDVVSRGMFTTMEELWPVFTGAMG